MKVRPKNTQDIKSMRHSGQILALCLAELKDRARAGVTTAQLAKKAATLIAKLGGEPAFLGYEGFPDVMCISVNDEVVHGIPSVRVLESGDLVSLDLGVRYRGLITDACLSTVVGGSPSTDQQRLLTATEEALGLGIAQAREGNRVGDISAAIGERLKQSNLGIVDTLSGHGVGRALHEPPEIPNFGSPRSGIRLKAGMTLAIEPIVALGKPQVYLAADGWTFKTSDGSLASETEHTVLITETEPEILTELKPEARLK